MGKKEFDFAEWQEFRKEVFELVILYHHVKEYSAFDKDKIEYINSFFHLSRQQAITSFFIKVGFLLMKDGNPSLFNFMTIGDYNKLFEFYEPKIRIIRNKFYAHSDKSHEKLKAIALANKDVDDLYNKLISSAVEIDLKFNDSCRYNMVHNANGINSIESIIDCCIELNNLKSAIMNNDYKANVELDIMSGKIKIVDN
jgi:hypothetical protein